MQLTSRDSKRIGIAWYWRRLKRVSLAELWYRVTQLVKMIIDRYFTTTKPTTIDRPLTIKVHSLSVTPLLESQPDSLRQIREAADRIIDHKFKFFGISADFGPDINWHLDPKTMRSWPRIFWGSINYRDGQTTGGIKFAWELNRLHHLPLLAIAYAATAERKYNDEIFAQLRSWLAANPYPIGINWISGIELGIRLVNLVYVLKFLPGPISVENHDIISEFVDRHATHLYRYPSKYTSAANHALAEALGLYVAGISFPDMEKSARWKRRGKTVLEREVTRQIYPDGSSFEHSIPYLQFVVDHFLIYFLLCREHGDECSAQVADRLKNSLGFISTIMDDSGNYPAIGDDDNGYLLTLWFGKHNNFLSILNTGAVIFDDASLAGSSNAMDSKSLLLLGEEAISNSPIRTKLEDESSSFHKYHNDAGLAVIRSIGPIDMLFVGNSGPLGLKPLAAHGHADALSFWLSIDGAPIFVDTGTYLYHSGGKWRDFFRSTAAHNTVRVDEIDQAKMVADFMFENFYEVFDVSLSGNGNRYVWTAKHDGYRRLADPVTHQRTVTYIANESRMIIEDEIRCERRHLVECFFHLHPQCQVITDEAVVQIKLDNKTIYMQIDKMWNQIDITRGDSNFRGGWYSHGFNELQETVTLRLQAEIANSSSASVTIQFDNALS